MSPRDLDADVVQARLAQLRELVDVLEGLGDIGDLRTDAVRRLAVERILTQSVDLVVDVCSHLLATQTGRVPTTYRESVEQLGVIGILDPETVQELVLAVGMRNILVHEYLTVDLDIVARAAQAAPRLYSAFLRSVAQWLKGRQ